MDIYGRIAAEALALVGAPFRLHGRSATTGVDCVGLVALAASRAGIQVGRLPAYQLRGIGLATVEDGLRGAGLVPVALGDVGDVLLARSRPMQLHLMIVTGRGLVHAHAGLARVVLMPPPSPWPVQGQWRFRISGDRG
ncbi:peptidoglycan endopeptidase [Sphingobium nicotianae]|uniref:Peptidoglycan endopeptidase n=1 Tax=Sphingobium nicotianae TaxID=2782607 RepID=A0A9X1DB99_9SPHN|nr:peptidoglycan endopeptidase [Sphingobium nicotianae]MBT2186863.1 peptidoglycan endopeptidase [Sphingobium nicotianae]